MCGIVSKTVQNCTKLCNPHMLNLCCRNFRPQLPKPCRFPEPCGCVPHVGSASLRPAERKSCELCLADAPGRGSGLRTGTLGVGPDGVAGPVRLMNPVNNLLFPCPSLPKFLPKKNVCSLSTTIR
jgi:hypothetical protein